MKVAIIHHNADMDGLMSGALAQLIWQNIKQKNPEIEYKIIGYNYGLNPDEDLWLAYMENKYDYYQFIDVTPPIKWLQNMSVRNSVIEIFDHHEPVYNEIQKLQKDTNLIYHFNKNICGCGIYWNNFIDIKSFIYYMFPRNQARISLNILNKIDTNFYTKLLELVSSYDTWKWQKEPKNWNALAINEYFLQFKEVKNFYDICFVVNISLEKLIEIGQTISNVKKLISKNTKHVIVVIQDCKMCIINDKANIYHIDNIKELYSDIDGIIFYKDLEFITNKINLSLRSLNDKFDCNNFVKNLNIGNGGGHSGAAGCQMNIIEFLNLISN